MAGTKLGHYFQAVIFSQVVKRITSGRDVKIVALNWVELFAARFLQGVTAK